MKQPTTEFSISSWENFEIKHDFLYSQGWILVEEKPLVDSFVHSENKDLVCSIGLYGSFSIAELHWCNKTPERVFSTINHRLTKEDYFKIVLLLNIKELKTETK